jgi:glutamate-1-semialdehyde aminotransferase
MAAGCVTLDLLTQHEIARINALGERLAEGLRHLLAGKPNLQGTVNDCGSLVHVNFGTDGELRNYSDLNLKGPLAGRFHLAALDEGLYFAPRGFMNTSTAMDEQVVDDALEACARAPQSAPMAMAAGTITYQGFIIGVVPWECAM